MTKRLPLSSTIDTVGGVGDKPAKVNVPNAITLTGFGLGAWWCAGGPPWAAVVSIIADEADGAIARERGEATKFGADLDWTSDIVLTALTLYKMGLPWAAIPAVTTIQVALREDGFHPPMLSFRAVLMLYSIVKDSKVLKV